MTPDLSVGPIITSLITVLVVSVGGVFWFGKLSAKVDRLQTDVAGLQTTASHLQTDVARLQTTAESLRVDIGRLQSNRSDG